MSNNCQTNSLNIDTQNRNHYTLVTVCNWKAYQGRDTHLTPNRHPNDTYKNDKNDKKYSPNSIELELSQFLLDLILERKPDHRKPSLQKWAIHIDRMIRLDNRDPERIRAVIRWCQQNDFWQNNIRSTEKLRKQFDSLELQMGKTGPEKAKPLYRLANGETPADKLRRERMGA